ncbi:ABC transporter [Spirochaetia bacterium]|nr:ABC transporter [Spirochaetia bacterium]
MSIRVSIRKRLSRIFSLEVELESADGCLGILGASGCGKSMTLKCIAGIETPDEGHISVNGRVLFDSAQRINLKPQVRRVGYLFQNYALFPRMTVLENVAAGLPPARRLKAREWLEQFGLAEFEGRYPHQLSGGQQQRAALARMLIREPEGILLDEPFSALDTNLREQMQLQFMELLETRKDVILVTHSRDEVFKLCSETLVMDKGRVLGKGPTRDLFANPGLVRIARLTGCKNISPVRQTGEREVFALDWGLPLRLAAPLPPGITHVGIRAHDFRPACGEGYNEIRMALTQESDEPFERVALFTNADACAGAIEVQGVLWWKYSKYLGFELPERLFVPPEALLLLR